MPRIGLIVNVVCLLSLVGVACAPESVTSGTFEVTTYIESSPEDLTSVSFTVTYTGGGAFEGSGTSVSCVAVPTGATPTFSDNDSDEKLSVTVTLPSGFMSEDDNLTTCTYKSTVSPTAANFTIKVKTAADEFGDAVATLPTVSVKTITETVVTTSTVTTTSTSLTTTSTLGS